MKQIHKAGQSKKEAKPEPAIAVMGKIYFVQCHGFRCAAYVDKDGKWRGYYSGEELLGPVKIDGDFD